MTTFCLIDVLRHGDTPLTGRFCGRSDPELTEKGRRDLARRTEGKNWDRIVSSPARRCREFAQSLDLPLTIEERFWEMDFGAWEGMTTEDVWAMDAKRLTAFWEDPTRTPAPDGEPWAMLCARVSEAFEELARAAQGERVLLLTHAGVMRALLVTQLGISFSATWKIALPTACLMQLSGHYDPTEEQLNVQLNGLSGAP